MNDMTRQWMASYTVVALSVVTGCSSAPDGEVADCLAGWWLNDGAACTTLCHTDSKPAECAASDCALHAYFGYTPNGKWIQGSLSMSAETRTLSLISATEGTWELTAEGTLLENGKELSVECTDNSLKRSFAYYARADDNVARVLEEGANAGGGFTGRY